MARETENAEGTESVPSAGALATVTSTPVVASEEIPQDATFQGFVVKPASPKYVIQIVSKDGAETINYRSSMDVTVTPAKAHNAVLRASVGDSVRGSVNSMGIIRSFEIVSKSETVTGITPGIKPGNEQPAPKPQKQDGMIKEHRAAKRKNRAQVQDAPSIPQEAPSISQDAPSKPAKTKCAFCRGPVHPDTLSEVQCANAMRFARRANRRTRVATTTDDDE